MNAPKTDSYYADASVEKGCCQVQPLLPGAEVPHTCPGYGRYGRHASNRRSFMKGFTAACGVGALIWLALSSAQHVLSYGTSRFWADGEAGYPAPTDGEVHECVGSTNWTTYHDLPSWSRSYPHGAETAFTLPVDADTLYLLSRGAYQHGIVEVDQSSEATDTVGVRVRVAYYYDGALERATVCHVERVENEHGVGIFTPPREPRYNQKDQMRFEVKLTLPAGSDGALAVKNFETKMPNFDQNVGDLWETVLFDNIVLQSSNGDIHAESITSEIGQFLSSNGGIDGHFNVGSALDLRTSNGGITSSVTLLNREGADTSKLAIHTSNGHIQSEIALVSESGTGGEFDVDTESTNGSIGLTFTDSPVDSLLNCRAQTTLGGLQVALHSAYEGTYSVETTLGKRMVEQRQEVEDPAGRGRHRQVSQDKASRGNSGSVSWVENDGSSSGTEGSVVLKTTLASARLII
ncbi:hypothetical protein HYDPIDRAFT_110134 [Hydnomerulius pinastri MD-312]|nr:hypothetical protein HYDPIDRAFT_110134 [Hydnomerulius pinastri MD-312]